MIEALALDANNAHADLPPDTFALNSSASQTATPRGSDWDAPQLAIPRTWSEVSSSAGTLGKIFNSWIYQAHTSNAPQVITGHTCMNAISRTRSVDRSMASENVFEIKQLTGYSWATIGELLNVDRRTISNWAQGKPVREANQSHVALVLSAIRYFDRGNTEENQALLERRISGGRNAFRELAEGNAERVKRVLSFGEPKRLRVASSQETAQAFDAILSHDGADGTEISEPLPFEAKPVSSKKALKRS